MKTESNGRVSQLWKRDEAAAPKSFFGARPARVTEDNPVGLSSDSLTEVVGWLDRLLATMFVMFHQYQKHHWVVEGPQFRDLHLFLEDSYQQVQSDLDTIAERLTLLGAIPTSSPTRQAKLAFTQHEPEGYHSLRDMVERDKGAERILCEKLRPAIKACTEVDDFGTQTMLKTILLRSEDRAHHLDHYLGEDSLTLSLSEHASA